MSQDLAAVFPLPVVLALAAVLLLLLVVTPVLLALRRPVTVRHPVDEHAAHPGADRA
ncbi:hypothetical protein [Massilia sp. YIM B02443]|uniref:hypothetical protein n=1 Tax=Massilia sp. YIM B02443 TaxID=3050127 RepID=UPI0025B6636E|nr:hypothetical protein [Massilia sp. YIM B02443]MDN4038237.1 hypothetical protein [Massilia sp. YIM B02443]